MSSTSNGNSPTTTTNDNDANNDLKSKKSYPTTFMCSGKILSRMEPLVRESDVFVVTAAKCGQTWLLTLLYHLKTKAKNPNVGEDGKNILYYCPWLELPFDHDFNDPSKLYDVDERIEWIEKTCTNPRIFKMHTLWEEVPIVTPDKGKMIVISRDPRDVPFSMFKHHESMAINASWGPFFDSKTKKVEIPTFEEYFESHWINTTYYYPHLNSFWPHRHDKNILWLQFEEKKKDPFKAAEQIVEFLGWDVTKEELQKAVELSSFGHMQRREETFTYNIKDFVREGGVGKNCARLSQEMEDRILQRLKDEVPPDAAAFVLSEEVTENSKKIRAEKKQQEEQNLTANIKRDLDNEEQSTKSVPEENNVTKKMRTEQ